MPWISLTSDLAPIKHVWDEMGRRTANLPPTITLQQLEATLRRIWQKITQEFFRRVIFSLSGGERLLLMLMVDTHDTDVVFLIVFL